jgi:hypothetical protein
VSLGIRRALSEALRQRQQDLLRDRDRRRDRATCVAMQERPPALVLEREAAAKAAWDANLISADDMAALEGVEW